MKPLNVKLQIAGWFIGTIVLPLTTWFLFLRSSVEAGSIKIMRLESDLTGMSVEIKADRKHLGDKLEDIQRSLGRIEGKLERRK